MRKPKETVSQVARLMSEWDIEKNREEGIDPERLGSQSNTYAYWKCRYDHTWKAKINNRYNGRGCPECNKRKHSSFQEQAVFYYIHKLFPDAINAYRDIFTNTMELDVYIPSIKTGIEYDGSFWHGRRRKESELNKYNICKEHGIKLIRIREHQENYDCQVADEVYHIENIYDKQQLSTIIQVLLDHLDPDCNMFFRKDFWHFHSDVVANVERDEKQIREYLNDFGENSFAARFPQFAVEWHPTKNGKLTPYMFSGNSNVKVWWKCKLGHEWRIQFNVRSRGNGCPYCSGQKVLKGFNDLETRYPDIAAQWDYEENGNLLPSMFTHGSGKEVHWICNEGHKWSAKINNRTKNNRGCPYCAGERAIIGVNDLETLNPKLARELHPTKNIGLGAKDLKSYSNKKVWWLCPKYGHEYEASVNNRSQGTGCPICSNNVILKGFNDLATIRPDLASEWDYEVNGDVAPNQVFPNSNKKYGWIDSLGHKWLASPNTRMRGTGCPYCSGNKVWIGFNDLSTTHPEIAKEWHPTKNGDLLPTMISKGYGKKIWWLCSDCNEEYESYIGNRIKGYGCKNCRKNSRGKDK